VFGVRCALLLVAIQWAFNGHSIVIRLSFDCHSVVIQGSFNCCWVTRVLSAENPKLKTAGKTKRVVPKPET